MSSSYPCVLPKIQIDTWGHRPSAQPCTPAQLAEQLFARHETLVCLSLLKCHKATTVPGIARCVEHVHRGVQAAHVSDGQIYVQPQWRVRWEHMSRELQNMARHNQADMTDAFAAHYCAERLERCIYFIVGPARAVGVQSYLTWQRPHRARGTPTTRRLA